MVKEKFVFSRITNGIERKYKYKLIKNLMGQDEVFGIEVERVEIKGDLIISSFKDSIELISPVKEKVIKLLNMLYENQVSPIHLVDIIGPYADEYVSDFNKIYSEDVDIVRV